MFQASSEEAPDSPYEGCKISLNEKALVILLVLAVAGGLFAQGWTFGGLVNGGIGIMGFDGNDVYVGALAKATGHNGVRAQFDANYTNDTKTAGMNLRFRVSDTPAGWGASTLQLRYGYGWVSALEGLLRVEGGRIQSTQFDTLDPISDGETAYDSHGIITFIKPHDYFTIGLGAGAGGYADQSTAGFAANEVWRAVGLFGLNINVPDMVRVNAALKMVNDTDGRDERNFKAMLSMSLLAVKDFRLMVTGVMTFLDKFSDKGRMRFYEYFAYNGIENLSLNLGLAEAISQRDAEKDLYFRAWFWLSYALNDGAIVPRLDFNYVMGGTFSPNAAGLHVNSTYTDGGTWNTYHTIKTKPSSPSVRRFLSKLTPTAG